MSFAETAALAFIMGQHVSEEKSRTVPEVKVTVTMTPPVKVKATKANEAKESLASLPILGSTETKLVAPAVIMPPVGSLEARGFLFALRKAKTRDEKIQAISAYVGYDSADNFGTQEMAAEMKAKAELRGAPIGGPSREEQRVAARSAAGFVAGLPDNTKRKLDNLLAQEKACIETLIQHDKDSRDMKRTAEERMLSVGLAKFERDRLSNIRTDLKALGFES